MALERTITMFVGEDKDLEFEIFDQAGRTDEELEEAITAGSATMQDVTSWDFEFLVRLKDKTTGAALIDKNSGSPVEIEVTGTYNATRATNTQRVVVHMFDTDTASEDGSSVTLAPKTYRYSLKRSDTGSNTVLAWGDFELLEATAR